MKNSPKNRDYEPINRLVFSFVSLLIFNFPVQAIAQSNPADAPKAEAKSDESQIRDSFTGLQKAFVDHNGKEALSLLTTDTKDYYRMLSGIAAKDLTPEELSKLHLTPLNLFMVKHAKKSFPKSFWVGVKKTDPDKLLKFAVEKGLGSNELTGNVRLGKVDVLGQTATGKLIKGAKAYPVQLGFRKESGQWKISLLAMFEQANKAAEEFLKKSGLKVEDLEKLVLKQS